MQPDVPAENRPPGAGESGSHEPQISQGAMNPGGPTHAPGQGRGKRWLGRRGTGHSSITMEQTKHDPDISWRAAGKWTLASGAARPRPGQDAEAGARRLSSSSELQLHQALQAPSSPACCDVPIVHDSPRPVLPQPLALSLPSRCPEGLTAVSASLRADWQKPGQTPHTGGVFYN